MKNSATNYSGIILAGGEGKRVDGRDKGLICYKGKPLVKHVIDCLKPQCDEIIISANRNTEEYKTFGYDVITDSSKQFQGPMAGIAATLAACKNDRVLVVPCDMPFLPGNLIDTLSPGMKNADLCVAESENRLQLVFLLSKNLLPSLQQSLADNQLRLMQWLKSQQPAIHRFNVPQQFKNLNHSAEL